MLEEKKWQNIPGALQADIFPVLRKPDVICSNAYIIRTPQMIVIIDPGSLPEQMALLKEALTEDLNQLIRPVYIIFTRCHVDHCYQALIVNELSKLTRGIFCSSGKRCCSSPEQGLAADCSRFPPQRIARHRDRY